MVVSFKVSKTGTRAKPKPKPKPDPVTPTQHEEPEDVRINNNNHNKFAVSAAKAKSKPSVDVAESGRDDSEISDADISFFINLFPDGYSIGNPSENRIVVQDDPKFLHPYDRTSESLFLAIERGLLPADFLDDIPCKYNNGAVACEVRDYRNSASEPGVNNGSSADSSRPITTKIRLKMSLENVVKDIPLISDSSWTYGDLMEAEARILMALNPKLDINPTPNIDRLCRPPTCTNLNLNIRELRRKRLRQMAGPDNSVNGKKICIDRFSENQNSALMVQPSDFVNSTGQNVVPASPSLSYQSKYQIGSGNPRVMQDHGSAPVQDMMNSYPESMNSTLGKRENQDSQLSSMTGLTKRARSNSMGLDGSQQPMDGLNSLMQQQQQQQHQQSIGRGIQLPYNGGMQKYPFEGSFNQEPFTMGQPGLRYNLKQEPVDPELNRNMQMVDSDVDPRLQQQRLNQQFQRSSFPPTPWNTLDNSRKEEQFQRRKSAQSPRVSSGTLPQSPLSSKSGEFSSGSHGAQYGAPQRDKSAVTSVPTVGGAGSLTSNAQMAARRSTSLPKTPAAMSGVGSPASVSNISGAGPFNASSPLIGKEADKSIRDKFSKIEMLTARYQLNMKKNKVDEYIENTSFSTQQLNHHLFNDLNNENPKDEEMPLSKSLVGGSMNVCKTRVLIFEQKERVHQGNGFSVSKSRTRLILSEKRDDGTVAMHYGELDDCDYLASEESLPTLPNTHVADLLAAQFQTLILREGYELAGDHLQPKPANTVRSSGDQPNNNPSGVLSPKIEMSDTVSGNEIAKPSDSGNNNNNASVNLSGARMHPPANSQPMPISQGGSGLLPPARPMQPESQPSFQQNQHNLMQQQMQRSSAMMLASNPLSHLNAMGQNSNMQQLGHMLNKTTPLQLQMLQQQQQQQQQPQMQRKMMMGLGNVGMGGNTGNSMVGLQGMGNNIVGLQGMGANRGISPPMSGVLSGMGNNMGQSSINMNQASNISNVISQQLRNGVITPVQAQMMNAKLRMVQQNRAMMGGAGGQSGNITGLPGANRQMHPGSSNYSMLGPGMNRANNVNPMQRTAMAPPKLMSGMNAGMNAYMNQSQQLPNQQQQQQMHVQQQQQQQMPHQQQQQQLPHQNQQLHQQQQQQQQESSSPLQAVLSPPQQQVGSPSMGLQQQASPQQMSQRTPMSPQLSSGAIHPQMSAGNQEANCPASPQLSSQTMGSVSSMTNSPMDMQGVNKSS